MIIEDLELENKELKRKLKIAKQWMEKEVKNQVSRITKEKIEKLSPSEVEDLFEENIEDTITTKITRFFGEVTLINMPSSIVENIISAEINYYNMRKNPNFDGLSVILSYHKALDVMIESFIIKWFRKFAHKKKQTTLRQNDVLEKSLNSVVNTWYILSVWRLFHVLQLISHDEKLFDYVGCFKEYLSKYTYLQDVLLSDEFMKVFSDLVNSEILGKKRHVWKTNFVETRKARELLIWGLENKNCLIYMLAETQKLDF